MNDKIKASPYRYEKFTATNDYAFKKIFGTEENKDILTEFISLVTGMNKADFADLKIANAELPLKFFDDKASRLDVKITLKDGQKIDIEMQNLWFDYYAKRSIYYWTELFTENFKRGDDYLDLKKCIAINILNTPFKLSEKMHSVYRILETETHMALSDVLEIHFLDLTKLPVSAGGNLEKWLKFIKTENREERNMLSEKNTLMEKANRAMEDFYVCEREREMYRAACRYESDRVSMINESERKGIAKGMQAGREEGRLEGIAQGRSEGFYQKALETAKNLFALGLSVENIAKATGLSYEEVEKCR